MTTQEQAIATPESNLAELRESWENGLEVIAEFGTDKNLTLVVILKNPKASEHDPEAAYEVNRYFPIGAQWQVSCDARAVTADAAIKVAARGVNQEMQYAVALQAALSKQAA